MAKKKSKKKPKQYNNYYGQSAAAQDINSWTNYLDRYQGKDEWAKKWMHDDSNIHFGNYVRDNESVWKKWQKSGKTDNKDLWAFGQADWKAGGNLKDRYVAKILKGKNPGDLNKTGSAYDDMGVVSVFKSARWGYDQKAQDKLRASWGKDYWGRKGYNKGHSVHWYDPKDKTNRYGVTEGVLGGGQAPKDLMHVNPNYLPVKEDKPKTEVADVNNGTSPPPTSPGAGGNSGRPRPANNGSFFNNLLTRYGNKQGLRDRRGSVEDAGSLLDKYTYNDRSKGYQGKGDGHQSSSKRLPRGVDPRSGSYKPRMVDHLGKPMGGGSYKPRWLDYVGKPTRGPKDINGGPRHPKGPKGVNSYKPGWFDHVDKPRSRSNWVNNETGEVWKPDPKRKGDFEPGYRPAPDDGREVWADDPRLQQWTNTSTGKPTGGPKDINGGPRHPKGPKILRQKGFYDKPGWLDDLSRRYPHLRTGKPTRGPKDINGGIKDINGGPAGDGGPRDGGSEWKHELTGPGVTGYHPHPKGPKGGGRYKPTGGIKDINGGHDGKGGPKDINGGPRRPKGPKRGGKGDTYKGRGWANYWQQSIPKRDDSKWSDDFFNQAVRMGAESQVIDREKLTERIDARSRGHMDEADYLGYLSRGQVRGENRPKWERPGGIGSTYEPNTDIKPWLDGIYDIGGK